MNPELAEQPEMYVADETVRPAVEEVLAIGLDAQESHTIDERSIRSEPSLRRRDADALAAQHLRMIEGNSVDGMTLGHAECDVTGTLGAS